MSGATPNGARMKSGGCSTWPARGRSAGWSCSPSGTRSPANSAHFFEELVRTNRSRCPSACTRLGRAEGRGGLGHPASRPLGRGTRGAGLQVAGHGEGVDRAGRWQGRLERIGSRLSPWTPGPGSRAPGAVIEAVERGRGAGSHWRGGGAGRGARRGGSRGAPGTRAAGGRLEAAAKAGASDDSRTAAGASCSHR